MELIEGRYRYFAFISYKREDEQWARWLQQKLEHYKLPSNLNGRTDLPREIRPVFKDTSELTPGNLPEQIHEALNLSKYLVVICSPRSAQSEWVNKEVVTFIEMERTERIIPFIIEGSAFAKHPADECFPLALRQLPEDREILGANVNEMGRDAAAVKVVARMFDVRFDELWQRYEREKKRRRNILIAALSAFVLAVISVAGWIWYQNVELKEKDWKLMEGQARMVAEKAREEVGKGNVYDAMLALLEMVPVNGNRPEVPEVEASLRIAYDSLCRRRWNYRHVGYGREFIHAYFSADDQYIIGESTDRIQVLEAGTLALVSSISYPDTLDYYQTGVFLSTTSDTIYVTDGTDVNCYTFPHGEYIKKAPFTEGLLYQYMIDNFEDCRYKMGQWPCAKKWLDSVGLPQNTEIEGICPAKSLLVYKREEKEVDYVSYYSLVLYDYKRKEAVCSIDNEGSFFSFEYLDISNVTFSPDGNYLVVSLIRDSGDDNLIIPLFDLTTFVIHCGESDCSHYSNWLSYGRDGNLMHSSMFEGKIKIFNEIGTRLLDSINGRNDNINVFGCAYMAFKGDMCLVQNQDEWYVFYKYNPAKTENETTDNGMKDSFDNYVNFSDTVVDGRYHILCDEGIVKFEDLKGEKSDWSLQIPQMWLDVKGFIQNNRYMVVYKEGFRGAYAGVFIVESSSGTVVYESNESDLYYSENQFTMINRHPDRFSKVTEVSFMPFDTLIKVCREATKGMSLTERKKKLFYL